MKTTLFVAISTVAQCEQVMHFTPNDRQIIPEFQMIPQSEPMEEQQILLEKSKINIKKFLIDAKNKIHGIKKFRKIEEALKDNLTGLSDKIQKKIEELEWKLNDYTGGSLDIICSDLDEIGAELELVLVPIIGWVDYYIRVVTNSQKKGCNWNYPHEIEYN